MGKYGYEGSKRFRPMSAWGYVWYSILFSIPIIGLIAWIICIFSDRHINRRSFARSYLCWLLLVAIIVAILFIAVSDFAIRFKDNEIVKDIRQAVSDIIDELSAHEADNTPPVYANPIPMY